MAKITVTHSSATQMMQHVSAHIYKQDRQTDAAISTPTLQLEFVCVCVCVHVLASHLAWVIFYSLSEKQAADQWF